MVAQEGKSGDHQREWDQCPKYKPNPKVEGLFK